MTSEGGASIIRRVMLAEEIMTRDLVTVTPNTTIREALEKFHDLDIRHLPIVCDGELVGIISDRDVSAFSVEVLSLAKSSAGKLDLEVREIMHTDVVSVEPGTEVTEIIDTIVESKIGAVPVVDPHKNRIVGIVSYIDILKVVRPFI